MKNFSSKGFSSFLERVSAFFFEVRSEPNTVPQEARVGVVAFYVVALASLVALPYNMSIDWLSGNVFAVLGEGLYACAILAGLISFWWTRRLVNPRRFYFVAVMLICVQLIWDAGGQWGLGALYIVSGYSVIFFALGVYGGVLIPLILLVGTAIRIPFGNFHALSVFNQPEIAGRYLIVLMIATALGIAAVVYQHFLVRNLARSAFVDSISGLASRVRIEEYLKETLEQARIHKRHLSLVAIKLQKFSQVNSTQGSAGADRILRQVGERIKDLNKTRNLVGRYSGTLFLIASEQNDKVQLTTFGQLLHDHVTKRPYHIDDDATETVSLTCELAVTRYPDDGLTEEQLLANILLTLNHSGGIPGKVNFFDRAQAEADQHRFQLAEELKQAVKRQEFRLVYHPKVHLPTGACLGAEVLLRWTSGRSGPVGPDVFIPLAEETGSIREITNWVIRQSLAEIATLDRSLVHAVNLSPIDLADPLLLEFISTELASNGLEPKNIEFEITEGVMMDNSSGITGVLHDLRDQGFRLAIDDFGTGYSSLSYLSQLPVNNLKIDQSFIRPLEDSTVVGVQPGHRIVEAIVSMTKALNLDITAEGVETAAQVEYLGQLGCTYAQGWYYAKPMALEAYRAWLANRSFAK